MNTDTILLLILGGNLITFFTVLGILAIQEARATKTADRTAEATYKALGGK